MSNGTDSKVDTTEAVAQPRRRRKPPLLRVVFDTNQLYTGSASDLLRAAVRKLIETASVHRDVKIEWFVPEMVRWEREHQMISAATQLLPSLQKLERILGHQLGITADTLVERIKSAIEKQISELGLKMISLRIEAVDWRAILLGSAFRRAPFEDGETEKGFRDAIILECVSQLIAESPKNPSACRIAVVTQDKRLIEALEVRTESASNVRMLASTEELEGLINTLVSNVTEEFVKEVQPAAEKYFFKVESKEGLYYSEKLGEQLRQKFRPQLQELPAGATSRENGTWYIGPSSFVRKSGQRITWQTSIRVEATSYKVTQPALPDWLSLPSQRLSEVGKQQSLGGLGLLGGESNLGASTAAQQPSFFFGAPTDPPTTKTVHSKGHTLLQVTWSVVITSSRKFTHPKVDELAYKETVWQ